jgi:cytochrome c biogenesis protein
MASTETELKTGSEPETAPEAVAARRPKSDSIVDKLLDLLSSVRLGVVMLSILLGCCVIGMLVMQQNIDGFRTYYENLTPAQRFIYTKLGFFDIYYSWYFTLLLAITGLNIILASIERFPAAWQYVVKPKVNASPNFIRAQMFNREADIAPASWSPEAQSHQNVADTILGRWKKSGFRGRISEHNGRLTVFAQKHSWNRLGAYVVHIALLTILAGGFLTNRYGRGGKIEIVPGRTDDVFFSVSFDLDGEKVGREKLPFKLYCTDIQQQLIRPEGGLEQSNTVDWRSFITIQDNGRELPLLVHLNNPQDYRGYRFFQDSFQPLGYARLIVLGFEPVDGSPATEVTIERDGNADVPGVGNVAYVNFYPDFIIEQGGPGTASGDFNNPVAELVITKPDGTRQRSFAFAAQVVDELLGSGEKSREALLVAGNKVVLRKLEKVGTAHTLAVQYDPGRQPVYIGFTLLCVALCGVFFFSHQRVWAVVEPGEHGTSKVYFGGNTNRNRPAFEGRFEKLVAAAIAKGGGK